MFRKIKSFCSYLWYLPRNIKYGFIQIPWITVPYIKHLFLLNYARDYELNDFVPIPYKKLRIKMERISALFPKWIVPVFLIFFFIPYNIYLNFWWYNHTIYLPPIEPDNIDDFYLRRYSFRRYISYYFKTLS